MKNAVPRPRAVLRCMLNHLGCLRGYFLILVVTLYSGRLLSQTGTDDQTRSKPLRFDLTTLVGYRRSMTFPAVQNIQGLGPRLILEAKPSYGIAVGVRLDEENLVELRWARQDSHVHLGGTPSPSEKVVLDRVQGHFTHEYILEDWPP
jgi:hypothetical protein